MYVITIKSLQLTMTSQCHLSPKGIAEQIHKVFYIFPLGCRVMIVIKSGITAL